VLFDLDGTLRDSRAAIWPATEHALREHGVEATREEIMPHVHYHEAVRQELAGHVSEEDFQAAFREKLETLRPQITMYEAAPAVLKILHNQGYKLGIVTSATTGQKALKDAGLGYLFDAFVGSADTEERKPHPEPVLLALEKLGCAAVDAVMVGDLAADIMAAKAAGLPVTIGITHGFGTKEMLEAAGADHIIDALEELPKLLDTI
jgi:pyrophosphatase PpaX